MTSREEKLLPPIDPSVSNENDWWEFELTEVKVLRPGKKLYANLLEATEQNPVDVLGELQLKPSQEHLLLEPETSSGRILIENVTHYAYGQTEDRSVELWVAGKAGWYRISPAKGYLPFFNRMVQAVDMYYFLMDKHYHGKKQLNPTFRNLCDEYVYHTHGDCETREQSSQAFDDHGVFLLRCMIEDEDDMEWNKTNVFIHLRRKFKDEYKEIMERLSSQSESEGEGEGEDEDEDEPGAKTPRHNPAAISKSQTDAVYQLIQELKEEGHLAKRRLHVDLLTERFSERYSFSKEDSQKIIAARASAVLEKLDEEETPGFRWSRYVIHRELTHAAANHDALPPALLTPLQPSEESSEDEALMRTQKSVLRPKNGRVSAKVMGKRNRSGLADQPMTQSDNDDPEEQDDEDQDAMSDVETPSKSRGHELIRTPLASARPRTRSFRAKSGSAASLLQAMLKENQPAPPPLASSLPIAKRKQEKEPEQPYIPPLPDVDEPEPEPEIWNCRMQGCEKTITAKGDERQKEIEAHAGEHDWDSQMRIELVESERRMHSALPVSNLMRYLLNQHLQQMREAFPEIYHTQNGNSANGTKSVQQNGAEQEHPASPQEQGEASVNTPSRQLFTSAE